MGREIDYDRTPDFQQRHFVYTHGYGIVTAAVNDTNTGGQPNWIAENIPQEGLDPNPSTRSCTSSRRRARPCRGRWSTRRSPCSRGRAPSPSWGWEHRHPRRLGPAAPGDHEVPRRPALHRRRAPHLERDERQAGRARVAAPDLPRHPGQGPRDRALPALRLRPVLHVGRRQGLRRPQRVRGQLALPVLRELPGRELHARLGNRGDGRVHRRDALLRRRRERAHHADLAQGLSVDLHLDDRDARGPARAHPLRRGPLQLPGVGAAAVPRHGRQHLLLQQRGVAAHAGDAWARHAGRSGDVAGALHVRCPPGRDQRALRDDPELQAGCGGARHRLLGWPAVDNEPRATARRRSCASRWAATNRGLDPTRSVERRPQRDHLAGAADAPGTWSRAATSSSCRSARPGGHAAIYLDTTQDSLPTLYLVDVSFGDSNVYAGSTFASALADALRRASRPTSR